MNPPTGALAIAEAQIGSFRATEWSRLSEQGLLLSGLRLRLAREWVLHTGNNAKLLDGLQEATQGLLSPTRRGELLDAIAARDWDGAFRTVTMGDLFSLSERYLERYSGDTWDSPLMAALRRNSGMAADGSGTGAARLRSLGGSAIGLLGCSHPHLEVLGTFEEYEEGCKICRISWLAQRAAAREFSDQRQRPAAADCGI